MTPALQQEGRQGPGGDAPEKGKENRTCGNTTQEGHKGWTELHQLQEAALGRTIAQSPHHKGTWTPGRHPPTGQGLS